MWSVASTMTLFLSSLVLASFLVHFAQVSVHEPINTVAVFVLADFVGKLDIEKFYAKHNSKWKSLGMVFLMIHFVSLANNFGQGSLYRK